MFESITWQEFISAIAVLLGGYYAISALLLYSKDLTTILNQKQSKRIDSVVDDDQMESNEIIQLVGAIKTETEVNVPREKTSDAEELVVQHSNQTEEPIKESTVASTAILMIGKVTDLLLQIKLIVSSISDENKEEVSLLLRQLLAGNPEVVQSKYGELIELFILISLNATTASHFEPNEIKSWWPEIKIHTDNNQ